MANWTDLFGTGTPTLATVLTTLNQPGSHTVISIDNTATLDSTAFGKLHKVSETSATFDITLPAASGNAGKRIGFLGDNTTNLTKAIRVLPASGTVDNQNWLMIVAERFVIVECDGTNWKIAAQNEFKLAANLEILISNAMSIATINEWLGYAPKNLGNKELTFNFNNGTGSPKTYTVTTAFLIKGYHNGLLNISGDMAFAAFTNAQGVYFDASGNETSIFKFEELRCRTYVQGFAGVIKGDANYNAVFFAINCPGYISIGYFAFGSTSTTKGLGIQAYYCQSIDIWNCTVADFFYAFQMAALCHLMSSDNRTLTTHTSQYGLVAGGNSAIGKYSTQPTGSVSNESATTGGVIR